jgi:hypothetical protein
MHISRGHNLRERVLGLLQRPDPGMVILAVFAAGVLALSSTILFSTRMSTHGTMKVSPFTSQGIPLHGHAHGCGSYWQRATVGHGLGATVQVAAGFCWDGTNVRWEWGLHRGDCSPVATSMAQVRMTCQISGGHRGPLFVMYTAQISPSLLPFMQHTVVLAITVMPQGTVVQLPSA